MEVKKDVLRKMPTEGLKEYLKEDSQYVSQAVQYAFEILHNERDVYFSSEEVQRIQNLLLKKLEQEEPNHVRNQESEIVNKKKLTNTNKQALFSRNNIIFLSIIFSPLLGGGLLFYNLKITQKNHLKNLILVLLYLVLSFILIISFNILYVNFLGHLISSFLNNDYLNLRYSETTFKILFKTLINFIFISYLWRKFFGEHFSYQSKNITIPIIICLIIYAVFLFVI